MKERRRYVLPLLVVVAAVGLTWQPSRDFLAARLGYEDSAQLPTAKDFVQSVSNALPADTKFQIPPVLAAALPPDVADVISPLVIPPPISQDEPAPDPVDAAAPDQPLDAPPPRSRMPAPVVAPVVSNGKQHPGHPVPVRKQVGKKRKA